MMCHPVPQGWDLALSALVCSVGLWVWQGLVPGMELAGCAILGQPGAGCAPGNPLEQGLKGDLSQQDQLVVRRKSLAGAAEQGLQPKCG